jgi:hypothetical protein
VPIRTTMLLAGKKVQTKGVLFHTFCDTIGQCKACNKQHKFLRLDPSGGMRTSRKVVSIVQWVQGKGGRNEFPGHQAYGSRAFLKAAFGHRGVVPGLIRRLSLGRLCFDLTAAVPWPCKNRAL